MSHAVHAHGPAPVAALGRIRLCEPSDESILVEHTSARVNRSTTALFADPDAYVTVKEIAVLWRVDESVVYRQIIKGALVAIHVGRQYRILVRTVQDYGLPPTRSSSGR